MEISQRLGRLLVVLALIVALLGSSIPVPARAATLTGTVAAGTAIAAGLVALGIGVGATETIFNNLVDSFTAIAGSDRVPVWISETADGFVTYLQESFLGTLLAHCFDSGVIYLPDSMGLYPAGSSFNVGGYNISCNRDCVSFVAKRGSLSNWYVYCCALSSGASFSGELSPSYDGTVTVDSVVYYVYSSYVTSIVGPYYQSSSSKILNCASEVLSGSASLVGSAVPSTNEDLTLGSVGATMAAPNYDGWRNNAIPVVPPVVGGGTADEEDAFPVTFPGLDAPSITGQTQVGAQSGITPGTVVEDILSGGEVVPETGTIADVITAIRSMASYIVAAVQAIPAAIADVFSPPTISDEYMISLSDFFPFCLPFDIYDLLSALAAEPQAPVFEWTISVPRWGISHDIEIDLSEWDDIARLFRTFELGAFVLGLALITRQKFLRS